MRRALVTGGIPAPYRIAVYEELAKYYDLTIFFSSASNENRNPKWFEKPGKVKFDVTDSLEARKRFQHEVRHIKDYDFVLAYEPCDKISIEAIVQCRLHHIPYYVNCDGAILRKNFYKDILKRFIFSGATGCFSSGKSATSYYRYYGVSENKIFLHKFTSLTAQDILDRPVSREEQLTERRQLGIKDKITIISVGQFIPRKGFDVLLKAWTKIKGNCQLFIIGGGNEKEKYIEYIQKNSLANVFVLDFMSKDLLFKYYKASDIFALPTREDIWGLVVNEAMANGLPVVTTNTCVAGMELIKEGINGCLVAVEDEKALAEKIQYLIESPQLLIDMKDNALKDIKEYTIENIAKAHIKAIEQTLPAKNRDAECDRVSQGQDEEIIIE